MSLSQAYASVNTGNASPLLLAVRSVREGFKQTLQTRRARARARMELECYTDRQLQDLGLSRADIPSVVAGQFGR